MTRFVFVVCCLLVSGCAFIDDFSRFEVDPNRADAGDAGTPPDARVIDAPGCVARPETCNHEDDDCDGTIDEAPTECSFPNGVTGCVDGLCAMTGCMEGFGDCTGELGCETDLSSAENCGSCGVACAWGEVCMASACGAPGIVDVLILPSTDLSIVGALEWDEATGDMLLGIGHRGTVRLPDRSLTTSDLESSLLRLRPDGTTAWVVSLAEASVVEIQSLPTGEVFLAGSFGGSLSVGGTTYDAAPSRFAGYIRSLTATGEDRSFEHYRATDTVGPRAMGVAGGHALLVGTASGDFEFSGALGQDDGFLVDRNDASESSSTRLYGGSRMDRIDDLAIAADGSFAIAASYVGPATFDGPAATSPTANEFDSQVLIAVFDRLGAQRWQLTAGAPGSSPEQARAVTMDPAGNVYWSGLVAGAADFGGGPISPIDTFPAVVASHTPDGTYRWAIQLRNFTPTRMTTDGDLVYLVGEISDGDISPDGSVPFSGRFDGLVAALDADDGRVVWARSWGGTDTDRPTSIELDAAGRVWVAASSASTVTLGTLHTPEGSRDGYVFRLEH